MSGSDENSSAQLKDGKRIIIKIGSALLVDKDKNPNWNPPSLDAVSDGMVNAFLGPLTDRDELGRDAAQHAVGC